MRSCQENGILSVRIGQKYRPIVQNKLPVSKRWPAGRENRFPGGSFLCMTTVYNFR